MQSTFDEYSDGHALYGDDFLPRQLDEWFRDEQEGYYNLNEERKPGSYQYRALNWRHGFRHLPPLPFEHVLGIGSAFGDELEPVLDRAGKVTILEPGDRFSNSKFDYVRPKPSGLMQFSDDTFDLITCFGVLHHIPNVSTVVQEMARCMKPGGWMLIREPTISLGDWNLRRPGLTRRERGIPLHIIQQIMKDSGLQIVYQARCMHTFTHRIARLLPKEHGIYNTRWNTCWVVAFDDYLSNVPVWSRRYHATRFLEKIRPGFVHMVCRHEA